MNVDTALWGVLVGLILAMAGVGQCLQEERAVENNNLPGESGEVLALVRLTTTTKTSLGSIQQGAMFFGTFR